MSLWVVVGGQFGSEGKGKISAFIAQKENIDICVRCGGPNSGHSFVDPSGNNVILRQLPTGFVNPRTRLLIPAGALIDPIVLQHEIHSLSLPAARIGIDRNAFIIEDKDREKERLIGLRERLSSTLCGVGAAVSRRVLRSEDARLAKDAAGQHPWIAKFLTNVSEELNVGLDKGKKVLVEGTQGYGLSLYHSDFYPHCTSRDTTASGFLSEVGLSPRLVTEIVLVFRTFPIRVAGDQAGPLFEETSWEQIRVISRYPRQIAERTSVTRNIRRVGEFDWRLAEFAIMNNRPTRLAVNGLDYLDYENVDANQRQQLSMKALEFLHRLEDISMISVNYIGVGPRLEDVIEGENSKAADQPSIDAIQTKYASGR